MSLLNRLRPLPLLRISMLRFGIVALLGEALYFFLYGIILSFTGNIASTLAFAGGTCILVNSYLHSRITFQVRFRWPLLLGYLQIQFLGYCLALLAAMVLERAGAGKWVIALATYILWACLSYMLTRLLYEVKPHLCDSNPIQIAKHRES